MYDRVWENLLSCTSKSCRDFVNNTTWFCKLSFCFSISTKWCCRLSNLCINKAMTTIKSVGKPFSLFLIWTSKFFVLLSNVYQMWLFWFKLFDLSQIHIEYYSNYCWPECHLLVLLAVVYAPRNLYILPWPSLY